MVRLAQNSDQPRIVLTIDAATLLAHPEVSKDACVIGVSRTDGGSILRSRILRWSILPREKCPNILSER